MVEGALVHVVRLFDVCTVVSFLVAGTLSSLSPKAFVATMVKEYGDKSGPRLLTTIVFVIE